MKMFSIEGWKNVHTHDLRTYWYL